MERALEDLVRRRAHDLCEYCQLPEALSELRHVVDHIIAQKHGGLTVPENLALACGRCNLHRGPNLSGIDPESGKIVQLFNPRNEVWTEHFRWGGVRLIGLTVTGRATIEVLAVNARPRIAMRQALVAMGKLSLG